jgi:hypothetical protein
MLQGEWFLKDVCSFTGLETTYSATQNAFLKHKTYKVLEPRNILYICIVYMTERVKISSIIALSVLYTVCGKK